MVVADGLSSNSGTQTSVATVVPAVTQSTASLGINATTVTINGYGFSTTSSNDKVSFDGGTTWLAVSAGATANQLTVSYTPAALGSLSAKVQVTSGGNTYTSTSPVQVATIVPVVTYASTSATATTASAISLPVNAASTFYIYGSGFGAAANDYVSFNGGSWIQASAASATKLTLTGTYTPTFDRQSVGRRQGDWRQHLPEQLGAGGRGCSGREHQRRGAGRQCHDRRHRRQRLRPDGGQQQGRVQ